MRNRRPADQRGDSYFSRTSGSRVHSLAERLEPTRPPARPRRYRMEGEPGRFRPLLRVLSGLFTFMLLMLLLVGGIAFLFDSQIEAPGPLERALRPRYARARAPINQKTSHPGGLARRSRARDVPAKAR